MVMELRQIDLTPFGYRAMQFNRCGFLRTGRKGHIDRDALADSPSQCRLHHIPYITHELEPIYLRLRLRPPGNNPLPKR